jgi:GDP-D-mannose dehydratase
MIGLNCRFYQASTFVTRKITRAAVRIKTGLRLGAVPGQPRRGAGLGLRQGVRQRHVRFDERYLRPTEVDAEYELAMTEVRSRG